MVRNFYQSDCPRCGRRRADTDHMQKGCPMRQELREALFAFKVAEGRMWKSRLTALWASGKAEGLLAELKTVLGPTKLYKVVFPKEGGGRGQ